KLSVSYLVLGSCYGGSSTFYALANVRFVLAKYPNLLLPNRYLHQHNVRPKVQKVIKLSPTNHTAERTPHLTRPAKLLVTTYYVGAANVRYVLPFVNQVFFEATI